MPASPCRALSILRARCMRDVSPNCELSMHPSTQRPPAFTRRSLSASEWPNVAGRYGTYPYVRDCMFVCLGGFVSEPRENEAMPRVPGEEGKEKGPPAYGSDPNATNGPNAIYLSQTPPTRLG